MPSRRSHPPPRVAAHPAHRPLPADLDPVGDFPVPRFIATVERLDLRKQGLGKWELSQFNGHVASSFSLFGRRTAPPTLFAASSNEHAMRMQDRQEEFFDTPWAIEMHRHRRQNQAAANRRTQTKEPLGRVVSQFEKSLPATPSCRSAGVRVASGVWRSHARNRKCGKTSTPWRPESPRKRPAGPRTPDPDAGKDAAAVAGDKWVAKRAARSAHKG